MGLALAISMAAAKAADTFPTKPIRIIVPAAAGGSLDITTRLVASRMSEKLGQPVLVDNRPGADTLLGTRLVKEAPADGYSILAQANGFSILPFLKLDPGYDPVKDFTGLGMMVRSPLIMVTGQDRPDRSVKDFIERAKTRNLQYAASGVGGPIHIASALFLQAAGIDAEPIQYKGNGAALPDVVGGRVEMIFDGYISSAGYISNNRLRPLAVTSAERITPLPDVPTFQEQDVNYTYTLWLGLVVRAGTPKAVVQSLSDALRHATASKELTARFRSEGSDPSFVTSDEMTAMIHREVGQMEKVARDLKLQKE